MCDDVTNLPQAEADMWEHRCPVEKSWMRIGKGEACSWCGATEWEEELFHEPHEH